MITILCSLVIATAPPNYGVNNVNPEGLTQIMSTYRHGHTPETVQQIIASVITAGRVNNVDPVFLLAVAFTESRWQLGAVGDGGSSHGPWQMCYSAARNILPERRRQVLAALHKWESAAFIAAAYWAYLRRKYKSRSDVVYNCGPSRCGRGSNMMRSTRVTRSYWRNYRRFKRMIPNTPAVSVTSQ